MGTLSMSMMILMTFLLRTEAQQESYSRCYTCRSRGDVGDCKDKFSPPPPFNASNPDASLVRHVKESPCYSGWCYKQIDGEIGDSSNSGKERCAYVMKSYKRVFICFCQGDQCNGVGVLAG